MFQKRNLSISPESTNLNTMRNPKLRSNSLFQYRCTANQEYSKRISLDPEGEKKMELRNQINPGHNVNVFYKTDFLKENNSLRACERANLQTEINSKIKNQRYQVLLEKDSKIHNTCHKKNNEIKNEFNSRLRNLKNLIIQTIRESLIFAKNNSPVGAMLTPEVAKFLEQKKLETNKSLMSLSYENSKDNDNEKSSKREKSKKNNKKQKNEFLELFGVDVENLTLNNINLDMDKAWNFILRWSYKGRNLEDIIRFKIVNAIMSLGEKNAADKVKHIYNKFHIYKEGKRKEKMEIMKKKKEEEEKRLEELRKMDPRELIRGKMRESLGHKTLTKRISHSLQILHKRKKKNEPAKKRIEFNGYKDVDKILDIIDKSSKDSKSRLFQQHYINIRRRKSVDLAMEKSKQKNQIYDGNVNNK